MKELPLYPSFSSRLCVQGVGLRIPVANLSCVLTTSPVTVCHPSTVHYSKYFLRVIAVYFILFFIFGDVHIFIIYASFW